ncbi:hypothetical protein PsYK624_140810 [Phanerochaete sordida]|uniref:Uncharacterized protein n=1 Tax=Phanerochaete sordida TaxID=48140 RepID=A0A9P3GPA4_9APHY|nr:hypothetical protein PsYK624_140810 [Phanerochaete sordida]
MQYSQGTPRPGLAQKGERRALRGNGKAHPGAAPKRISAQISLLALRAPRTAGALPWLALASITPYVTPRRQQREATLPWPALAAPAALATTLRRPPAGPASPGFLAVARSACVAQLAAAVCRGAPPDASARARVDHERMQGETRARATKPHSRGGPSAGPSLPRRRARARADRRSERGPARIRRARAPRKQSAVSPLGTRALLPRCGHAAGATVRGVRSWTRRSRAWGRCGVR